jgi:hypothetical protein
LVPTSWSSAGAGRTIGTVMASLVTSIGPVLWRCNGSNPHPPFLVGLARLSRPSIWPAIKTLALWPMKDSSVMDAFRDDGGAPAPRTNSAMVGCGAARIGRLWRLWYQIPMALPVIGPRMVGDPKGRYLPMLPRS